LNRIPIGRMGTATDIATGIVFLASDDSGFMTGAGLVRRWRHHRAIRAPRFDPLEELEVGSAECQGQSFVGATMSGRIRAIPAIQPSRWEWVFMPHSGRCLREPKRQQSWA
jgi:Enoyl-(Acyl carrier protein) reductase